VPRHAQRPPGDPHGRNLRVDPHIGVADPLLAVRSQMVLATVIADTATAADDDDLGVSARHCVTPEPEITRQRRRPVGQEVLVAAGAATSEQRRCPSRKASTYVSCQMQPTPRRANIHAAMSPATSTAIAAKRRRRLNRWTGSRRRDSIRARLSPKASKHRHWPIRDAPPPRRPSSTSGTGGRAGQGRLRATRRQIDRRAEPLPRRRSAQFLACRTSESDGATVVTAPASCTSVTGGEPRGRFHARAFAGVDCTGLG
jgi:hypothetical protein